MKIFNTYFVLRYDERQIIIYLTIATVKKIYGLNNVIKNYR